jgi:hypothetical protein
LQRGADGRWTAIRQTWLGQLPKPVRDGIQHGWTIDPRTLNGEASLYSPGDPNCCAARTLRLVLTLSGDTLSLRSYAATANPS